MKITKTQLKRIIKEELGMMSEQEPEMAETHDFKIYEEGHFRGDPSTTLAYIVNVPMSMIDTSASGGLKTTYVKPERLFELTPEALEQFGFPGAQSGVYSSQIEELPELVQVSATINLKTGEVVDMDEPPKFIDAQG